MSLRASMEPRAEPNPVSDAAPLATEFAEGDTRERQSLRARVRLQRWLCSLTFLPLGLFVTLLLALWGRYRIVNRSETRRVFQELCSQPGPLIICANHLTYIDSAIISWALAPVSWFALHYGKLPWNLPAGDHFRKGLLNPLLAFFLKCIFIHRDGSHAHKAAVMDTVLELVRRGEPLTIFPEGRRSRSGRIDSANLKYGVGKLLAALNGATVLCLYVRADGQRSYSKAPPRGSRFHVEFSVLRPHSLAQGRDAYRDFTSQIVDELKRLEMAHLARSPQQPELGNRDVRPSGELSSGARRIAGPDTTVPDRALGLDSH